MHFLSAGGFLRPKNGRVLIIFNGQYDNFQKKLLTSNITVSH